MVVFGDLGFDQSSLVTMKYGDRFRVHRKLTHMGIGIQQVRSYQNLQSDENKVVLRDLLTDPANFALHLERYAASVVSIIGFGRRISSFNDPIITEVVALMQKAAEHNVPGKSFPMILETFPSKNCSPSDTLILNVITVLAELPCSILGIRNTARGQNFFYALAEEAAQTPHPEQPRDCYAKTLFEQIPKYNLTDLEVATLAGALFGAGSDTRVRLSLHSCSLAVLSQKSYAGHGKS
jgi:hypothetical protein